LAEIDETQDITRWLRRWAAGDSAAFSELMPRIYGQLRRLAAHLMKQERQGHTLDPTGVVHEAYLRLAGSERMSWQDRAHFFAVAAQAMRRVLVDAARRRHAGKRGGDATAVTLEGLADIAGAPDPGVEVIELDRVLSRLEALDERQARVVELRCFTGLTVPEIAGVLAISERTAAREWRAARAWLRRELIRDAV
jgi:RNA polymerase sigma-70 factor, ECF subfamily